MSHHRHGRLDRRAVAVGVTLSVVAHAALMALVRVEIRVPDRADRVIAFEEVPAQPPDEVIEVLRLLEPQGAAPSPSATSAAAPAPASAPPIVTPAIGAASAAAELPPTQAAVSVDELTYDQLIVLDPLRNAAVELIAFDELPVAQTTAPAEEALDVPIYQPGSVGKAKRAWASDRSSDEGTAVGTGWGIVVGSGDGHCPVPSTRRPPAGRIPPPYWNAPGSP